MMEYEDPTSMEPLFLEKLSQLKNCAKDEQKQKIEEMNEMIDEMNEDEIRFIFTNEVFNEIDQMIEEKIISMENAFVLLKHIGYSKVIKNNWLFCFQESSLNRRFEKMIVEEEQKKEEKNEKLMIDLCECYLLLNEGISLELHSICRSHLLKVALKKEGSEEMQKEVEIALLALSNFSKYLSVYFFENERMQKLFMDEIREIIQYHQEHHNLTRLAYQSVWKILTDRFWDEKGLLGVIENELHFAREAGRELEELMKCVDWKREKEEDREKETKEELVLMRWLNKLEFYFHFHESRNEECIGLIRSILKLFRAAKDNHRDICKECFYLFGLIVYGVALSVDCLLKGGIIDAVLEEIQQQTLNDEIIHECLNFFNAILMRLKKEEDDEIEEAKRQIVKMELHEKMEEEGYEDILLSFQKCIRDFSVFYAELI